MTVNRKSICLLVTLFVLVAAFKTLGQGTAFMYQGRLNDNGSPANGNYDLRFSLFDAFTNGNAISVPQTNSAVPVASGVFTTNIDFGPVFTGNSYWLQIGVRTNGNAGPFTLLFPRQPLLPVPYAIFANTASNLLGTLSATQLIGTLPSAQVSGTYGGSVNFTNVTNAFIGKFSGNGSNLTSLNGSQITSGTVADARLSGNVALLNTNQTFTGTNTFTGPNLFTGANSFTNRLNAFTGTFFGNGLVGWIPVFGTATQAVANAGYLLLNSNITTVTLPPSNSVFIGDIVRISGPRSGGWKVAQGTGEAVSGYFLSPTNAAWLLTSAPSAGWRGVASSADGIKMVASAVGGSGIYVTADSGKTWNQSSSTFSPSCLASSADGTKLYGGIFGGGIVRSVNSGGSWALGAGAPSTNWNSIACSDDGSKVVAVVNPGRIYTSTDFGATWTQQLNPPIKQWFAVASSGDGVNLVAGAFADKIYTSANSGVTWNVQNGSDTTNWTAVASSRDGTKLAAAAFGGRIYTSVNSGGIWTQQTGAPTAKWYGLACSADGGRIVAVINPTNGIYASANFGLNWTKQAVADQSWYSVACSDDCTRVIAGFSETLSSGGIYSWQPAAQLTTTTVGANGSITGGIGSAVELQYIGDGQFMPIGGIGIFWAN